MTLEERYKRLCETPSSINELLPVLRRYAEMSESVAEFGVDIGQSTTAFLMAQPRILRSLDVVVHPEFVEFFKLTPPFVTKIGKTTWMYWLGDSRTVSPVQPVDLLFIDSAHCYDQMHAELERHHAQVRKYILLHDTHSFGEYGEAGPPQVGIVPAIGEFLVAHREWKEEVHYAHNNGLQALRRVTE